MVFFEAVPVQAWYNFMPDIDYATLSSDEVEHEFSKRDRSLSYFTKKYNFGDDQPEESGKVKHSDAYYGLKIHDDDDMDAGEEDIEVGSEDDDEKPTRKVQKKRKIYFVVKRRL